MSYLEPLVTNYGKSERLITVMHDRTFLLTFTRVFEVYVSLFMPFLKVQLIPKYVRLQKKQLITVSLPSVMNEGVSSTDACDIELRLMLLQMNTTQGP